MRRVLYVIAFTVLIVIGMWMVADAAQAQTTEQVVYNMLRDMGSPLAGEAYTLVAFRRYHGPDFSIIDYLTIAYCESSLGKGASTSKNVGSIKGGKVGTLWRDLRTGTYGGGYNVYPTWRAGQRALIRLVWERYGGSVLRGEGLHRYWGTNVPGFAAYQSRIAKARAILIESGQRHGLAAVHLDG
ncbi:MAG: hypothetical protein LC667_02485 [Thioalkalivibrio sp.]|nr:hypothetical protein [Thioalkalivibrio sp.]